MVQNDPDQRLDEDQEVDAHNDNQEQEHDQEQEQEIGHPEDQNNDQEQIDGELPDDYWDMLNTMSEQWLMVQLTHNVSAAATNSFWNLAFKQMPNLLRMKSEQSVKKNVSGFIHMRRKLYQLKCPKVHMKFVYMNKTTQEIEVVNTTKNPRHTYTRANYVKLYEEAHVKVN